MVCDKAVARLRAHYHELSYDRFYRQMTIGQMFMDDHDLIDFLILTAPLGSSDDSKTSGKRTDARARGKSPHSTIDEAHNLQATVLRDEMTIQRTTREQWTRGKPHFAAYLDDYLEKGRDGRNRR